MYILGIQNAVAKGTEGDSRFRVAGPIGELDLEDANVVDNRRRDGCDEEEDGGGEEEEGANVVNDTGASHLDGIDALLADRVGEGRVEGGFRGVLMFTALSL